jgi:hypothetical protein
VVHLCPGYLKDSRSLQERLARVGKLPPTAVFVVADAVSMYTNISISHLLISLKQWLTRHKHELPEGFPTEMVLASTEVIMNHNIFQFDNTFWQQITGTAMGTPCACTIATIYCANHEELALLPSFGRASLTGDNSTLTPHQQTNPMLFYGRLIDDTLLIWDTALLPEDMILQDFCP